MKQTSRKTILILTTVLTCLLMLSTATAVPVANSDPVMDLVEEQEQLMELSTTIEDIINSDCSLVEKKESLLQLKNDFEDIENFPWDIFLVIVSSNLVMILFPTIGIPINVILSLIWGVDAVIFTFFQDPKFYPPTDPLEYILSFIIHFIFYTSYFFLLGPVVNVAMTLKRIQIILEDLGILPNQSTTQTNIIALENLSSEPYDIHTVRQA